MRKRLFIALILILMLVPTFIAQADKPAPSLRCTTEYDFVGHHGVVDTEDRLLSWQGTVSGDVEGVMQWWMVMGPVTGQVTHFVDRWEIWDGEGEDANLLLAGDEAGTTTARPGKDGIWRANGIVTETSEDFEDWDGRHVHDGGEFTWQVVEGPEGPLTIPEAGTGTFRIN